MNSVILSATRTPIGAFMGSLSQLTSPQLGAIVIKEAVNRAGISPEDVDEVIMGNVLAAGVGQAPARQASIYAGLPESVECMTINKVCGSGLKAVMLADQAIKCGDAKVVVAGGQESMSNAPYLLQNARTGYRMGNGELIDSMVNDGLWDVYNKFHMGIAGELCSTECDISRESQDDFAIQSYKRALDAQKTGRFANEIVNVVIPNKKGDITVSEDEEPSKVRFEKVPELKAVFKKDGAITAANASSIDDGAAALVVTSDEWAESKGLKPLAKVIAHCSHAQKPEWFTTAPTAVIKKILDKTGLTVDDIDLFEINEAFSCVPMHSIRELGIPHEKVNVNGGAVALGHPIGASGARILTTLIYALKEKGLKRGLASLCIGGGEANALIIEIV
ncbi:MAG: acetyl-CoA C-acyltransferase [Ignavibacteriae bacterium HGW-Ignavibacteriae-1]|jgi:acetyl-CoA C-acetyltransferase|nr:MAG: acetyl-CoA C-acyltransferase [Ignavibacteriae bacterium HGW-Ignavibacteriae-1]